MGHGDDGDRAAEQQRRPPEADREALGHVVAGGGAQGEGEQDRQPVEALAPGRDDRVDRERSLAGEPGREGGGERDREEDRRGPQRDAEVVDEVVGDLGADHADQHDRRPVETGDVPLRAELGDEHRDEDGAGDVGRVRQAPAQVRVQVVRGGLADGRAEDLDDPEVERDLGDLVQHRRDARSGGCRGAHGSRSWELRATGIVRGPQGTRRE